MRMIEVGDDSKLNVLTFDFNVIVSVLIVLRKRRV